MEEQKISLGNTRVYHERVARLKRVNRYLLIASTILLILTSAKVINQMKSPEYFIFDVIMLGLSILNLLANFLIYTKKPTSEKFRYIVISWFSVIYTILLFCFSDVYIALYLPGLLMIVIMYYDVKISNLFSVYIVLINCLRTILFIKNGIYTTSGDGTGTSLVILLIASLIMVMTNMGKVFMRDTVGAVMDERNNIKNILLEVLEISAIVQKNVVETSKIIKELKESTNTVNYTVEEIAKGTISVSENIIEQTHMTEEIQNHIKKTEDDSNKVVFIVKESSESIETSLQAFLQLQTHSKEIASINENVSGAMNELQEKARAVTDIIRVIVNISNQTNLLALNASIEAARAGEAGKGFAVVADEIRSLAEKTKESTEHITDILVELNNQAKYASDIVNSSIDVTTKQSESISNVSERIDNVHLNMSKLADNITDISNKVTSVSKSNQTIVDNISQVSTVCEEITASTQNAAAVTNQSDLLAERAVVILNELLEVSHRFDKYQE